MTEHKQIYKCEVCGNITEVLHNGVGELVCCGKLMKLIEVNTIENEGKEKHVPVIEKTETSVKIKVGSVPHPMEEKHYIEWIELLCERCGCKQFLKPGDAPEVVMRSCCGEANARAFCNVHGLWKS